MKDDFVVNCWRKLEIVSSQDQLGRPWNDRPTWSLFCLGTLVYYSQLEMVPLQKFQGPPLISRFDVSNCVVWVTFSTCDQCAEHNVGSLQAACYLTVKFSFLLSELLLQLSLSDISLVIVSVPVEFGLKVPDNIKLCPQAALEREVPAGLRVPVWPACGPTSPAAPSCCPRRCCSGQRITLCCPPSPPDWWPPPARWSCRCLEDPEWCRTPSDCGQSQRPVSVSHQVLGLKPRDPGWPIG